MKTQATYYQALLKRFWWVVALATLGALSVSLFISYVTKPNFETRARFLVSPGQFLEDDRDMIDSLDTLDKRSTVATYAAVMGSTSIMDAATEQLAINDEILDGYTVSTNILPEASIIELTVSGSHPQLLATLTNSLGEQGINYIREKYRVYDINFLDRAQVPQQPASPQPLRDALLAAALGFGIGIAAILLWDQVNQPDTTEQEEKPQAAAGPGTITEQQVR
jgi:capsular polysaccharide biosynthesis protein